MDFYIDDVLIHTKDRESHILILNEVLNAFKQENVKVKLRKCHFLLEEITYLGYNIKKKLVTPDPNNIIAVKTFPTPTTIKKLQRFLEMVNDSLRIMLRSAHLLTICSRKISNVIGRKTVE